MLHKLCGTMHPITIPGQRDGPQSTGDLAHGVITYIPDRITLPTPRARGAVAPAGGAAAATRGCLGEREVAAVSLLP
jgi:hypothetical protein